jgi:integrase
MSRRSRDKRTRWPCVVVRHQVGCPAIDDKRCRCEPGYVARVWDRTLGRPVPSPTYRTAAQCIKWQQDKRQAIKNDTAPTVTPAAHVSVATHATTLTPASDRFIAAIKRGTALSKKGKPYKKGSIETIEGALKGRIDDELGELMLDEVRRGHVQTLVDEMVAEELSGSRIRNVVNALRSLYNWAIPHELALSSPIENILLPAVGEKPRNRIATPLEFQALLLALKPPDAVPFAIGGYATARSQEIRNLGWPEVDFKAGMLYLADEEDYAKSDAARRPFPMVVQLRRILHAEWERQDRPATGLVCPGSKPGGRNSGKVGISALYTRADEAWDKQGLEHIRLQDCRHTASSWMHAAGIDLKTRSVLMGHATTASTDGGRGSITDDRYTHLLPGEIEKAGKRLAAYLTGQVKTHAKR